MSRPTRLEIDTAAISANAAALVAGVQPAAVCAVVKADGYGHGAVEVARAAVDGGARWLAVAVAEEGAELREAGITAPVLVLADATEDDLALASQADLTVTIASVMAFEGLVNAKSRPDFHLKVDTGMHRLGCDPREVVDILRRSPDLGIEPGGIYTHLAVADDPTQDEVTVRQLASFTSVLDELERAGLRPPVAHAANSAGALFHPAARLDMVRAGIALYGQAPDASVGFPSEFDLRPAMSLTSRISAVRSVTAGDGVSYGWIRRLEADARIATVPIGYADGVPRCLGETNTEVLVRGRRCPLAGRVTMDQLMLQVADDVQVGDEVVLIGSQGDERVTVDDWAAAAGTINYEVLTGFGGRLPRRYV